MHEGGEGRKGRPIGLIGGGLVWIGDWWCVVDCGLLLERRLMTMMML